MGSTDWEEIKRLAADFQRAQLSSNFQKLSERNCVEIISKLIRENHIELYFTSSGKEYVTPNYLVKQICDELYINGGRITLTELSTILEVNLDIIEKEALNVTKRDRNIHLVLGQLVSEDHLDGLAEEVNEKLQLQGFITVGEIAQLFDLPSEFVLNFLSKRLGHSIKGQQDDSDPKTIFTDAFISRHEYQIRGILSAITHPTSIAPIITKYNFQERLFFATVNKLLASGILSGSLSGGNVASQAAFIPSIYSKSQFDWVDSFLKQNGYLEFKSLNRLGISDAQSYIKKNFKDQNLVFISSTCVNEFLIEQIIVNIDDAVANDSHTDILPFLPSGFSGEECSELIEIALKARQDKAKERGLSKTHSDCQLFCDSFIVSENLITRVLLRLEEMMPSKAKEAIAKGVFKHQLSGGKVKNEQDDHSFKKKDERRKKATGGKSGGGTQGRETKTKSTKNKHKGRKGGQHSDEEQEEKRTHSVEFLSIEEIIEIIGNYDELQDCFDDLLFEISSYLYDPLSKKFQTVLEDTYSSLISLEGDSRKKNHQQLQEKVIALLCTVRLAEKSIKEFSGETQSLLSKYLLKSLCSDIVNEVVLYLADDFQIDLSKNKEFSPDLRLKIINQLDMDLKTPLLAVHKILSSGASVEDFLSKIDDVFASADIIYKKKDNKRDKQILMNHRSSIFEQLDSCVNFASCLHLVCLILFQAVTNCLLHASGKFVPQILGYLQPNLSGDFFELLREYQGLVMTSLTSKDEEDLKNVSVKLEELTPKLKELTISYKKASRDKENSVSED